MALDCAPNKVSASAGLVYCVVPRTDEGQKEKAVNLTHSREAWTSSTKIHLRKLTSPLASLHLVGGGCDVHRGQGTVMESICSPWMPLCWVALSSPVTTKGAVQRASQLSHPQHSVVSRRCCLWLPFSLTPFDSEVGHLVGKPRKRADRWLCLGVTGTWILHPSVYWYCQGQ